MTPRLALAASLFAVLSASAPARALTFNFTTVNNDTLTADQASAFRTAADTWSSFLSDSITVNLRIGFSGSLGTNVLGSTSPTLLYGSQAYVSYLLALDSRSNTDSQASASLSTSTQRQLAVTSAQAKALGGAIPSDVSSDGTIEFSTAFSFSTSRNADGTIAPGTYDLVGIAEHEIGHLLGFVSSIDGGTQGVQTVLDQFRWSAPGTRSVSSGASAYFSVNGGTTNLAGFSTGNGEQASHWSIGTAGVMVPEVGAGQVQNITALDVTALDAIGYDVAVPEPGTLTLLAFGTLGAALTRRRRA